MNLSSNSDEFSTTFGENVARNVTRAPAWKKEDVEEPKEPSLQSLSWKDLKNKAKEVGVSSDEIEEASDLEGKERVDKIISFIQQKI